MARFHSLLTVLALVGSCATAVAQTPSTSATSFVVFLNSSPVGREEAAVETTADGIAITGRSQLGPPLDVVISRAEMKYRSDWTPESMAIEGVVRGTTISLTTTFANGEATSAAIENGARSTSSTKVSPQSVVVPNIFFGFYEALAQRLLNAEAGARIPAFVVPQAEIPVTVRSVRNDRVQAGRAIFGVRQFDLAVANPGGDLSIQLSVDERGRLVRLTVPVQGLDVVREDLAASTSRTLTHSNPTDEPITIPALGFNIAGTLTRPPKPVGPKAPAVLLLSGSTVSDRDSVIAGVPIMSQLAGAIADAGFVVVRFDRRGAGQSGGRAEAASITDFSDDAKIVLKWVANRKDVDPKRIAVVGHGEGAWIALLTATRDKRVAAVVSLAGASTTGADLILEQQAHALDQLKASDTERAEKVALQKQIHQAALTGQGWEQIPRPYRTANTQWFQSFLKFDPARVLKDVDQPLLIVSGELDRQVPVQHAEQLAATARKVSDSKAVELVRVAGVNHLLVPATTGEIAEYASLKDRTVSRAVMDAVAGWLEKALEPR